MSNLKTEGQEIDVVKKDPQFDSLESHAHRSLIAIGFLAFLILFAYFVKFAGHGFSEKQEDWGVFGDFIGGILNPTISLAALYWLTRSIVLQKKELKESREALLEAAYAQAQQAKSSEVAAKLQLLSIEMEIVSSQLAAEVAYQMQLLHKINHEDSELKIYDRQGALRSPSEILGAVDKNILKLSSRRNNILRTAKKLEPKFEIDIMIAGSI